MNENLANAQLFFPTLAGFHQLHRSLLAIDLWSGYNHFLKCHAHRRIRLQLAAEVLPSEWAFLVLLWLRGRIRTDRPIRWKEFTPFSVFFKQRTFTSGGMHIAASMRSSIAHGLPSAAVKCKFVQLHTIGRNVGTSSKGCQMVVSRMGPYNM